MRAPYPAVLLDVLGAGHFRERLRHGGFEVILLPGKRGASTAPGSSADGFRSAAARIGVPIESCVAVVSEPSHARAAREAGVGLVVGITDVKTRAALETAGADRVLDDIGQLDLGGLAIDPWNLTFYGFDSVHEGHREALMVTGNGYVATRGAQGERTEGRIHYPGTYLAGVNDTASARSHGRTVREEHLVNLPNWLAFDLRIGAGSWWSEQTESALEEEVRRVDLRRGVLTRTAIVTDGIRRLRVTQTTFVSMRDRHLMMQETVLEPLEWAGKIDVRSGIDAHVRNSNAGTAARHLSRPRFTVHGDALTCEVTTRHSRVDVAFAVRQSAHGQIRRQNWIDTGTAGLLHLEAAVSPATPLRINKTAAIASSRDPAIDTAAAAALRHLDAVPPDRIRLRHEAAWQRLWERYGIEIDADPQSQAVLNLHVFHVLQAVSDHTPEGAGIPARGLHGEGYLGHVFWDELFVLPVLGLRNPQIARTQLDYRWNRLEAARAAAAEAGLPGARFPWQSGTDGTEQTPGALFNPRSHRWMPDHSARQLHVGLAVAYNAWQFYELTADLVWLADRGAELIIEVVRHFVAMAEHDPADGRFHIDGVMGPDEYHDGPPTAPGTGLRDNAYTNVMTAWSCRRALDALDRLRGHLADDLIARLDIRAEEREQWSLIATRMFLPLHGRGVISQFDGYDQLEEFDWNAYRSRYGNVERLDLILEAEGDTTNRYKVAKQADVLMLVYTLGVDVLTELLDELGYQADLHASLDYYLPRTSHGSTLSRVVTASVLAQLRPDESWPTFREALDADLDDTQGGTTRQGIHLGAMAGTVDLAVRSYAGLRTRNDELQFTPRLPAELRGASFRLHYRGQALEVHLDHARLTIRSHASSAPPIQVTVGDRSVALAPGAEHRFSLS